MDIKIEYIDIKQIIGYKKNVKKHSNSQVIQIAASIQEAGFVNPILIDENNIIIAGHGRYKAAKYLKMSKVPCVRLKILTDKQKRKLRIKDNRLSEMASWDWENLKAEIIEIGEDVLDFRLDNLITNSDFDLNMKKIEKETDEVLEGKRAMKIREKKELQAERQKEYEK